MEATPTMIWAQPPGIPSMGNLFLNVYNLKVRYEKLLETVPEEVSKNYMTPLIYALSNF